MTRTLHANSFVYAPLGEADRSRARSGAGVAVFAATLLLSSTLLFLVQPMFARLVLPRLGGSAAVWNTCMVFFQACLLAGYAYSHFVTNRLRPAQQVLIHAVVLALPLLVLPVSLPKGWAPPADANPIPSLLWLLTLSVGLPFFAVSTTAPIVQRWFSSTGHRDAADPYFLYAASNAGSMLALLGYPTIVEPLLRLGDQTKLWTWGYAAFATLTIVCGVRAMRCAATPASDESVAASTPTDWLLRVRWVVLALIPSSYLLGVTTYITTDVAAVPLLWVIPLALYLLTFILVFARRQTLISHRTACLVLPTAVLAPVLFLVARAALPVWAGVSLHLLAFFAAAMVCHGELARLRPGADRLTDFYLMMSLGGVLGGAFNALAAPLLFTRAIEYPLAIVLACAVCPSRAGAKSKRFDWITAAGVAPLAWLAIELASRHGIQLKLAALALPALLCVRVAGKRLPFAVAIAGLLFVAYFAPSDGAKLLEMRRSFFGVHRVVRSEDGAFNELYHGTTLHGRQSLDAERSREPLTYYHRTGPVGAVVSAVKPKTVGVIGLGVGSVSAYAEAGDSYTFYEIDPAVRAVADASGHFHYLADARSRGAKIDVVLGDARLTLASAPAKSFDLLILDAFSGDAIPLHLLTREALSTYLDKLNPDGGVLLAHVSNLYLDLEPVLANLAADAGCVAMRRSDLDVTPEQVRAGKSPSKWVAIARDRRVLEPLTLEKSWTELSARRSSRVWTDDYSNILSTLR